MATVRVGVIRAAGINCDEEVMYCWRLAGADPTLFHVNELVAAPHLLDDCRIITIPGGFSYGDDIGAGVILAQRIQQGLLEIMHRLIERGGGILGICNGFQALVKAGLLPGEELSRQALTVTYNDSDRFEARWVRLEVCTDRCPFLTPGVLEMPVDHAEGKVVTASEQVARQLLAGGYVALRYVDATGDCTTYPANPNGSVSGIAGICDATGRVLGLMPHPDRNFDPLHHPLWTRQTRERRQFETKTPDGLQVFVNAVRHWA